MHRLRLTSVFREQRPVIGLVHVCDNFMLNLCKTERKLTPGMASVFPLLSSSVWNRPRMDSPFQPVSVYPLHLYSPLPLFILVVGWMGTGRTAMTHTQREQRSHGEGLCWSSTAFRTFSGLSQPCPLWQKDTRAQSPQDTWRRENKGGRMGE